MDEINAASIWLYGLSKDCPAKTWWDAEPTHPAVYRALRINKDEWPAVYACAPFRLARVDGAPVILAAYPAPRLFDDLDTDWLGIEQVLCWNPANDTFSILDEHSPALFGRVDGDTIFGDARSFLQQWAAKRAAFAAVRHDAKDKRWHITPTEADEAPGPLVVGDLTKIRWPLHEMPESIECMGVDPKAVNRAILKSARLPRAFGSSVRAAA